MKAILANIIGTYTVIGTGNSIANADWPYIISGCILILTFWFIYKIILRLFYNGNI